MSKMIWSALFAVATSASASYSANAVDYCALASNLAGMNPAPQLFVAANQDNSLTTVTPSMDISVRNPPTFVYLGQFVGSSPVRGAAVVKVGIKKLPGDRPTNDVGLKRQNDPGYCGNRILTYLSYKAIPIDFETKRPSVSVREYVTYHATSTDTPPILSKFHFKYTNSEGKCVKTDDKTNGNRQQFLINYRTPDMTAQLLSNGVPRLSSAMANPPANSPIQAEMNSYTEYSRFTTRIATYSGLGRGCFVFTPKNIVYSVPVTISVNDLEARTQGWLQRPDELVRQVEFRPAR